MLLSHKPRNIFHFFIQHRVDEIYYSIGLRRFGVQLVGIYEPIFIFLFFQKNLSKTFFYFAAMAGLYILLVPLGGKMMSRFGAKHNMLFSIPFLGAYYLTLFFLREHWWLIFVAILLGALNRSFFLPAFHSDFAAMSQKKHRGRQLGILNIITIIGALIAPLLGALLLTKFGFFVLFSVAVVFFILSSIPLFMSHEIKSGYKEPYKEAFLQLFKKPWRRKALSFGLYGFDGALSSFFWPLFLFSLAISFDSMGSIASFALLFSLAVTVYISRLTDKKKHLKLFRLGCYVASMGWLLKALARTALQAFAAQSFYLIGSTLNTLPLTAYIYDTAQKERRGLGHFIVFREMSQNLGAFFFLLLGGIVFLFTDRIYLFFILGALGLLLAQYFSWSFERQLSRLFADAKQKIANKLTP